MTTPTTTSRIVTADAFDIAADALLELDDPFAAFEAIAPLLTDQATMEVAARIDACPVHFGDVDICRDDEDEECASAREAL